MKHTTKTPTTPVECIADETSQQTRIDITNSDQANSGIEQMLYCDYGYQDCILGNRCNSCNLSNYGRDCHNNLI